MKSSKNPPNRRAFILTAVVAVIILSITIWSSRSESQEEAKIPRNDYGQAAKKEYFEVQPEGEKREEIEIEIQPREYTEAEIMSMFRQAMKKLDKEVIGENKTADHIQKNLSFPNKISGFPFEIVWELSRYDVVDMNGAIQKEKVRELDKTGEGILMELSAVLRYKEREALYSTQIRIFDTTVKKGTKEKILALIREEDEQSKENKYLILPKQLEGKALSWSKKRDSKLPALVILALVGGGCVVLLDKQKKEQEKKARLTQMLVDYPSIISQFTMLMGAGMTAKNTWKKITDDYRKKKDQGKARAAYDEMLMTWQEMQSGFPEAEAYERFARRCGLPPYMKFGALLSQNLKKGAKGMADSLKMEAVQAMEERKSRAKKLGEEAGTKLLGPLFLMLTVVMAVIIIPAFWSIQF